MSQISIGKIPTAMEINESRDFLKACNFANEGITATDASAHGKIQRMCYLPFRLMAEPASDQPFALPRTSSYQPTVFSIVFMLLCYVIDLFIYNIGSILSNIGKKHNISETKVATFSFSVGLSISVLFAFFIIYFLTNNDRSTIHPDY